MNLKTPPTLDLAFEPNSLYYGDCLEVMARWPDESVDTIYGDPPFNSKATYSILWGGAKHRQTEHAIRSVHRYVVLGAGGRKAAENLAVA